LLIGINNNPESIYITKSIHLQISLKMVHGNMVDEICEGKSHPNGQMTIPKSKRDELGIEPNDNIYFIIVKVISSNGDTKYKKGG